MKRVMKIIDNSLYKNKNKLKIKMSEIQYEAFCFKCKAKKKVIDPIIGKMKTGMNTVKGMCPDCKGKMYKILPKTKTV